MAVDQRRLAIGGAVLFVLVWGLWTFWWSAPAPVAPPARAARGAARQPANVAPVPVAPVKLADLTAVRDEPGEGARNPFRFQPKPAPPPPKPVATVAPPISEAPPRPVAPPGPPPLPPIPLKLLGVVERQSGVKWAVLTDGKTPTPMYGKDGDIIDGRYAIVKIGTESIEMTYADGRGRQVIRLTGQ